jgi:UDP-N-acetylmuramate dehydrogenase
VTALDAQRVAEILAGRLEGRVEVDHPLAMLTTYRVGGPAAVYVEPSGIEDVVSLGGALRSLRGEGLHIPVLSIGRGSNLVVSDQGWQGLALRLGGERFSWIMPTPEDPAGLAAGAGTPLPQLANWAARRGLAGAEFLIAIPGSVGGAVRMNAGAHGREVVDCLESAHIVNLQTLEIADRGVDSLEYGYRTSNLTEDDVVLQAKLHLEEQDPGIVRARIDGYRQHRADTQPGALQNAGSVFKNPPGDFAGRLVEAAGLKGFRVGGAAVSELHANFFVASAGARAQDVYDLVHEVRRRVGEVFGVELTPEIRFAGAFDARPDNGMSEIDHRRAAG